MELKKFNKLFVIGLVLIMVQGVFATTLTRSVSSSSVSAGSTITVTLSLHVTTNLISVAPVEDIPQGWTVSGITGGFMHSEKQPDSQGPHRIEWIQLTSDPNVSLSDQTFTYQLQIPSNASGTISFAGSSVIFANKGTNSTDTIGGTQSITIIGTATTTTSTTTTTLPVPAYAVRTFSSTTVRPGASFTVYLNFVVNPAMMPTNVGIAETVPTGWTISSVSNNGLILGGNQITWFFSNTVTNLTNPIQNAGLTYTITAPSTTGVGTFSGTVDYGTGTNAISGSNRVTVQRKSTNNNDFIVTLPSGTMYANNAVAIVVTDSDSKDPVAKAGVDVYLGADNNGQKVAYGTTDENGTFTFTPAAAGQYTIYVDMSRYREYKESLTVSAGAPTTAPTTTAIVTTTQQVTTMPVTTIPVTTTPRVTTTSPPVTEAPATTQPEETTTTLEEVTPTTEPSTTGGGSNMVLIGIVVIIIIAAVVFFLVKGKGKGKPAENGKKGKEEKASKPSDAKA